MIVSRVLLTWGETESGLNERLDDVIAELESGREPDAGVSRERLEGLKVRLTAKAAEPDGLSRRCSTSGRRGCAPRLGDMVFGVGDDTMESVVLDCVRVEGWTLGLAESVTGGLVGARLTGIPGASDVFVGSIVWYATEVKRRMLGVTAGPVVSESAAREMAGGALERLGADVAALAHGGGRAG